MRSRRASRGSARPLNRSVSYHMILRPLVALMSVCALAACDVVSGVYQDRQAAERDGFFERGWLPSVLPKSASNIRWSNDLDLNTAEGTFELNSDDLSAFPTVLQPHDTSTAPFADWKSYVDEQVHEGAYVGQYSEEGTTWVFLCSRNSHSCEYVMWYPHDG